jgi:hypothetical protein
MKINIFSRKKCLLVIHFANDNFCTMNTFSIALLYYKVFFNLQYFHFTFYMQIDLIYSVCLKKNHAPPLLDQPEKQWSPLYQFPIFSWPPPTFYGPKSSLFVKWWHHANVMCQLSYITEWAACLWRSASLNLELVQNIFNHLDTDVAVMVVIVW